MASEAHCLYCFDVIASHFRRTECPDPSFDVRGEYPLFVTWSKKGKSNRYDLRGCIGCLKPLPITSLKDYALTSALRDRRFSPMREQELPYLECAVSLLTHFEVAASLTDWEIGVHGVLIDFVDPAGISRTAVYLPDVIPEQGWSKEQTIESLIRKSGYDQPIPAELHRGIQLTRYQSTKVAIPYERWAQVRGTR